MFVNNKIRFVFEEKQGRIRTKTNKIGMKRTYMYNIYKNVKKILYNTDN